MNTVERHQKILEKINNDGKIKVQYICEQMNISPVTARKDLKLLEEKGLLYRIHGGATKLNPYAIDKNIDEKEKLNLEEKSKIGLAASKLIEENDSIIIGSGSTTLSFAKQINPKHNITVITSALNVALELNRHQEIEVIQLGGIIRKQSSSVTGVFAESNLKDFSTSKFFLGADGIDIDFGITTTNMMEARLNREMIHASQKTIVLADSNKFGKRGFGRICGFDSIDQIITDAGVPNSVVNELEEMGIKVTIVS